MVVYVKIFIFSSSLHCLYDKTRDNDGKHWWLQSNWYLVLSTFHISISGQKYLTFSMLMSSVDNESNISNFFQNILKIKFPLPDLDSACKLPTTEYRQV